MTIRQWAEKYCLDRGMSPDEANHVIDRVVADPGAVPLRDAWGQEASGYPKIVLAPLAAYVRRHAIRWIEENAPEAFYRSNFGS